VGTLLRRLESVAVRRRPDLRARGNPLLHPAEGRHLPLARRHAQPARPRFPHHPL